MKLYLVRHGETEWNREGRMQGRQGVRLNETGRKQVEKLREGMTGIEFDVCYASPLARAMETAEILLREREGVPLVRDERLVERGFGEFEGKSMQEFLEGVAGNDTLDIKLNYGGREIEPIREVLDRAESFLNEVKGKDAGHNVLVVAHGSLLRALHFCILGYTEETNLHETHFENAEMREYEI